MSSGSLRSVALDRLAPVVEALGRVVLVGHVPAVHDQALGADLGGGVDVLLEQLAARDPLAVVGRGDVDQVGRVHVEVDAGGLGVGLERGGAALVGEDRSLVALRVAEEELHQRRVARLGLGDRVGLLDVGTDAEGCGTHGTNLRRAGDDPIRSGTCGHEPPRGTGSERSRARACAAVGRSARVGAGHRVRQRAQRTRDRRAAGGRARPRRTRPGSGGPARRPPARARGSRGSRCVVSSPKSASRTCGRPAPVASSSRLAGFTSRCTTPTACTATSAWSSWSSTTATYASGSRPCSARRSSSEPPRTRSMTTRTAPSSAHDAVDVGEHVRVVDAPARWSGAPGGEHLDRDVPAARRRSQARCTVPVAPRPISSSSA